MKRNLMDFFLVFSVLLLGSTFGFSNHDKLNTFETEEKVYISPGCVYVAPNGIFINTNEGLVAVNCLFADTNGVYILTSAFGSEASDILHWTCPHCGHSNSFLDNRCKNPSCPTNQ